MALNKKTRTRSASQTALAGAVAFALSTLAAGTASAVPDWASGMKEIEKCGGVAKAGKNDCGAKGHSCGGKAKSDNLPDEWVYTPVGLCEKIGGKVLGTKKL